MKPPFTNKLKESVAKINEKDITIVYQIILQTSPRFRNGLMAFFSSKPQEKHYDIGICPTFCFNMHSNICHAIGERFGR